LPNKNPKTFFGCFAYLQDNLPKIKGTQKAKTDQIEGDKKWKN